MSQRDGGHAAQGDNLIGRSLPQGHSQSTLGLHTDSLQEGDQGIVWRRMGGGHGQDLFAGEVTHQGVQYDHRLRKVRHVAFQL